MTGTPPEILRNSPRKKADSVPLAHFSNLRRISGASPLSLQCIAQRYVQWFNWRHHKTGHLFERRYKAILVDTDEYLKELAEYIHLNPVRSRIVRTPEKHKWSSHQAYLGKMTLSWLETDFILSMFSPDPKRAQASFKEFVDSMIGLERNKSFHGEKNLDSRLLGDEHFVLDILDGLEEEPPSKPDLEMVLVAVEAIIGPGALRYLTSAARDARSFEVRALAAWGDSLPAFTGAFERAIEATTILTQGFHNFASSAPDTLATHCV